MPLSVATIPVISSTWLFETVQTVVPGVAGPIEGAPALAAAGAVGVGVGAASAAGDASSTRPTAPAMNGTRRTRGLAVARTSRVRGARPYRGCSGGTRTV